MGKSAGQGDKDLFVADARNTDRLTRNLVKEIDSMLQRVDQDKSKTTSDPPAKIKLENTKAEIQVVLHSFQLK